MRRITITLHPRFAAALDGFSSVIFVGWLTRLTQPAQLLWWLLFRNALWLLLISLVYPAPASRWRQALTLGVFGLGMATYLLLIDWMPAWYAAAFCFSAGSIISFWLLPKGPLPLASLAKAERRWRLLLAVIGVAGLSSGWFAVSVFQLLSPALTMLSGLLVVLACSGIGSWWWREYGETRGLSLYRAAGVLALISAELLWVLWWWPIGYLAAGFVFTILWYVLWLWLRFYLSRQGIRWRKQAPFLAGITILLLVYLVVLARWR